MEVASTDVNSQLTPNIAPPALDTVFFIFMCVVGQQDLRMEHRDLRLITPIRLFADAGWLWVGAATSNKTLHEGEVPVLLASTDALAPNLAQDQLVSGSRRWECFHIQFTSYSISLGAPGARTVHHRLIFCSVLTLFLRCLL